MPYLDTPFDDIMGTRAKVRVLRYLTGTALPLSAREVARHADVVKRSADLALAELVDLGVVERESGSHQGIFRINPRHPLADVLVQMFATERQRNLHLIAALRHLVSHAGDVLWAGVYGSTATGNDSAASDLDVAVITSSAARARTVRAALAMATPSFDDRWGRVASVLVLSRADLRRLTAGGDPLVTSMLGESRRVYGSRQLRDLMHGS